MSFEADEEILQDFLIEAGEILELLSEQLVELEQNPEDKELLNAIFRGFHTVKGGAGFLQLDALVECCHVAENVFDLLRNGQLSVTTELMDVVLQALDAVNEMFDQVKRREVPTPADAGLIASLGALINGDPGVGEPASQQQSAVGGSAGNTHDAESAADSPAGGSGEPDLSEREAEISDEEFASFLTALDDSDADPKAPEVNPANTTSVDKASNASDEITEDEFETLLDQLHGAGKFDTTAVKSPAAETIAPTSATTPEDNTQSVKPAAGKAQGNDEITDAEFESLLDELHGKGKFTAGSEARQPEPEQAANLKSARAAAPSGDNSQHSAGAGSGSNVKPITAAKTPAKAEAAGSDSKHAIATEVTVRVDTKRLDDIMNMVGELVLVRNRLKRLGEAIASENMTKAVANLDVVTSDLQSAVMQTRMQPIKKVFGRFPRVVRDLARNLKKEVKLILRGEDTDLDKNLVEALSDPLVHLVRNAVDHGIETPDVREQNGKARIGRVVLSAQQEGDHILLSIEDDGAGMDADVLRGIAVEKGLYDADGAERLSDQEAYSLIFAAGFSTKKEISDVSGRGVGMDVVKTKISQLNGTLRVDSELGKGSTIIIKVPLTLAIMPTLMVMLGQQAFAFPLVSVVEIFHLDLTQTNIVDGQECIVVRENVYPLFHVKRWLVSGAETELSSKDGHVVIVAVGTKRVGLVVDQLVGQEEVVIKPLGKMLTGTPGMAGATITGDGRIALILDIPTLLSNYSATSRAYSRPLFSGDADTPQAPDKPEPAAVGS